jgi:hypothetical protein
MSNLLSQASLVMIPSGYKEDVVYSQIPTNGSGDLSFTRASNGTRINSAGLVEVCPWNLCTYSEQFTNAAWLGGGNGKPTMTDNFAEAPNGTMTASKMEAVSDGYQLRQNNAQENTQMNLSVWLRTNTGTKTIQLFLNNASTASQNITVTTTWTRYEINGLVTSLAGSGRNGLNTLEALTSSAYILVWGFQLSVSTTAKPYFPTTDRLNVPRLTYQNGGGGCPSLLLEKQSTNLVNYSQDFGNAYWSKGGATITANATTSPDGTQDADKIAENTTSTTTHYINKGFTLSATTYTLSVFAKASERKWIFLIATTSADVGAFFDLENGVVGNVSSGYSASIENFGNGWYRCNLTFTATAATWYINYLTATANNTYNYAGTIGSGIFVYGAQLEASSYPTSYIPTTSSSATRVADACSKTGISSLIGQTSGSVFFDFTVDTISAQTNDPVLWYMKDVGAGERYMELYSNGNLVYAEYTTSSIVSITKAGLTVGRHKCAIAYATDDFVFYVDGVQVGTDTSGTPSGYNTFGLQYYSSNYQGQQKVNQVAIFPTRLTNAELASLTTI